MKNELRISLAAARVNAGYTQQEACKLIGVSKNTLIAWESGKRIPNPNYIKKIEEVYKINYSNLNFFNLK